MRFTNEDFFTIVKPPHISNDANFPLELQTAQGQLDRRNLLVEALETPDGSPI